MPNGPRLWARMPLLRFALPVAAAALLIAVIVGSNLGSDDGTDPASASGPKSGATADESDDLADSTTSTVPGSTSGTDQAPVRIASAESPLYDARPEEIPLDASVTRTTGLTAGDVIPIRVTARPGSEVFGFTAFLCRGDVEIKVDAQARPTSSGYCVSRPLSPESDSLVEVAAQPPYTVAEGSFRVGLGSDTFELRDGSSATVTCDADHPCQLVLKLQFPNGYGFEAFPLTFR